MANSKFFYGKQSVSEKAEANYVYINTRVNVFDGEEKGYMITLKFPEKYTSKLEEDAKELINEAKESEWGQGKQWLGNGNECYSEDENGNHVFKMKSSKQTNGKWTKVKLVDSKRAPMPLDTNIGTGSIVRAIFTPAVYNLSKKNWGVTWFIDELQVVDLKEYQGGGGSNLEFPEDDGYVAPIGFPDDDTEEVPF